MDTQESAAADQSSRQQLRSVVIPATVILAFSVITPLRVLAGDAIDSVSRAIKPKRRFSHSRL